MKYHALESKRKSSKNISILHLLFLPCFFGYKDYAIMFSMKKFQASLTRIIKAKFAKSSFLTSSPPKQRNTPDLQLLQIKTTDLDGANQYTPVGHLVYFSVKLKKQTPACIWPYKLFTIRCQSVWPIFILSVSQKDYCKTGCLTLG